jgi:hypothetical protein
MFNPVVAALHSQETILEFPVVYSISGYRLIRIASLKLSAESPEYPIRWSISSASWKDLARCSTVVW